MTIRKTKVADKLSKRRLLELDFTKCYACRGRGVVKNSRLCKKCLYFGLRIEGLTNFKF